MQVQQQQQQQGQQEAQEDQEQQQQQQPPWQTLTRVKQQLLQRPAPQTASCSGCTSNPSA
jgi:hypothetical protein